jgi:glc operon protein GlcG
MNILRHLAHSSLAALFASATLCAVAQAPSYGPSINLEQARKVIAAAQAEARKSSLPVAVAVFDTAGQLVAFEKMDDTQTGSIEVAQDKGRSAALFRRPTKVLEDVVASGGAGLRYLSLRGGSPIEGGLPIVVGGKIIGAIGVSGGTSTQDGMIAKPGAEALK